MSTLPAVAMREIFDEHLENLGFAWSRRRRALRSPDFAPAEILELEELMEAHADGLAAAGKGSSSLLRRELNADEPLRVFAAAYALLAIGTPQALTSVSDAFATAAATKLDALTDALALGPATPLSPRLSSLFLSATPTVGAAAGQALAFHDATAPTPQQLERFLRADDPATRVRGWRIAAYYGLTIPDGWYEIGFSDEEADVKHAAFDAAAWNRSPCFYPQARRLAAEPTPDSVTSLATFAAVAPPDEYQVVVSVAVNAAAGPDRFRVIGSFGHPYFVELLIKQMENADPLVAGSAAAAFEKMTGRSVASRPRTGPGGGPSGEGSEAGAPAVPFAPDPASAQQHWADLAPSLARCARICRGMDVSQPLSREQFAALDMESRWEYCLRMRLFSGWQGTPLVLERYPQRF
jgi:uncharacterized protein (TIGR02270 family)